MKDTGIDWEIIRESWMGTLRQGRVFDAHANQPTEILGMTPPVKHLVPLFC